MNINWYPGHMAKAKRMINENLKLVDLVVEVLDARIPYSSRNPDFKELFKNKMQIIILNKADLADPNTTEKWQNYYASIDTPIILVNSKSGTGIKNFLTAVNKIMEKKFEKDRLKGMLRRPVKIMVCGIPNSGKSTFINKLTGSAPARTGDKPGVTKDRQWIKINTNIHLLDTPGVLWPKFNDDLVAMNLAFTQAINDDILDIEQLCRKLIEFLSKRYPDNLKERYCIGSIKEEPHDILLNICENRKFFKSKGEPDILKASTIILDEFRSGRIGKISLEEPNDF
ncbi:MAG: ribosome biogenesis GTPase YlqF [Clostridia bacterium]|jgi:ribosome biogenesis GTPase A|nr:ribosome biogenesis GTPase YlqF [Clostridia bacterium]NLV34792.1 ribosome biogenesis GTPase YlqF [Clostridiaceae bacterium]